MRYIKQLFIILLISLLGEILNLLLPLPIPAAVYGLVLMLLALQFKIVKLSQIEETGTFLLELMPIMFVPYAVALLPIWPEMKSMLLPLLVISIACTVLVFLTTGHITQLLMKGKGGKKTHE